MISKKRSSSPLLQFFCQTCENPIRFSVLNPEQFNKTLACSECGRCYAFDDETLLRHLQQFEALCRQIHKSQDILGTTAIAIDVGIHHVRVPFNILLTRLSTEIELMINGKKSVISFRVEPIKDIPEAARLEI